MDSFKQLRVRTSLHVWPNERNLLRDKARSCVLKHVSAIT